MKQLSLECQLWIAEKLGHDPGLFDLTDKATLYDIVEWLGEAHQEEIYFGGTEWWHSLRVDESYKTRAEAILAACEYLYKEREG